MSIQLLPINDEIPNWNKKINFTWQFPDFSYAKKKHLKNYMKSLVKVGT